MDGRMAPYPQINHCDTLHCCCFSVAQSCLTFCNGVDSTCQAPLSFTISWSFLKLMSIGSVMSSNHLIFFCLLFLRPSIFLASGSFPVNRLFTSGRQSIRVSASISVLSMNIQHWFPLGLTDLLAVPEILESSSAPQFKSISSSVLSFLYSPTLTSIHDHWKKHSFDCTDLCWQSNISDF